MADQEGKPVERDWRPVPDPTLLTTQALQLAITALEDKLTARQDGMREAIEARLAASDRASQLAEATVTRVPTLLDRAVADIRALTEERFRGMDSRIAGVTLLQDEKFRAVQIQFEERDVRAESESRSSKTAVDAALQAAKEASADYNRSITAAIAEMKAVWTKQSDSQVNLLQTETRALRDQISTQNERITRIESNALGVQGARNDQHISTSTIISIIALIITLVGIGVTAFMRSH